jgi:hypothetical protein
MILEYLKYLVVVVRTRLDPGATEIAARHPDVRS